MDYNRFVRGQKTLLVSPAGYGKTHSIVECIKYTNGKQLILTHTHAGIASIKDKLKTEGLPTSCFQIETITSFAQKYVHSFYVEKDIPEQDSRDYHPFLIEKASKILASKILQQIIENSYTGLFVDEYQDCTRQQHEMIKALSTVLPTHILGDPLQAIFDFNGESINMLEDLADFDRFPDLEIPNRWYQNGNNKELGDHIKILRECLMNNAPITLANNPSIGLHVIKVEERDFFKKDSEYRKLLDKIIINQKGNQDLNSLLIIVPEYEEISEGSIIRKGDINSRVRIKNQIDYSKSLVLLEAIDDKTFYSLAKAADELIGGIDRARKKVSKIKKEFLIKIFNATEISEWFNDDNLKDKRKEVDQKKALKVAAKFDDFFDNPSSLTLYSLIIEVKSQFKFKNKRDEVYRSLVNALKQSHLESTKVIEAMKNSRNHIRRSGRKIKGKCIGTTLLTKGLEFDTVVLLDAHRFDSPQHLYVALSRCCRNLIIFTENLTLSPY